MSFIEEGIHYIVAKYGKARRPFWPLRFRRPYTVLGRQSSNYCLFPGLDNGISLFLILQNNSDFMTHNGE